MKNNQKILCVFGGTGFVGRYLIRKLCQKDYRIIIATRQPHHALFLKPLGNPGQIELVKTNVFNSEDLKNVLKHSNKCINLIGILNQKKHSTFENLHAEFPNLLSKICTELNLEKLVHISALGVQKNHTSKYMHTKLQGEINIRENFKSSVILRPSLVFGGPEDKFFNTFASIAQFSPFLPLIGGGKTKFAPIYVGDLCKAIVKVLELNNPEPKIYELGGPENYSFKELMKILLTEIRKKRFLISIPWNFAKFLSFFLQMLPNPLLTQDQIELLKQSNVVSGDYPALKDLGIKGTTIQSVLPKYIWRFRSGGEFNK